MMKAVNIRTSLGDAAYAFDEAVRQVTVCARRSEKAGTGLYLHAWTDRIATHPWADPVTGASTDVWSDGLGWYALLLADALAVLPKDHAGRPAVEDIYRRMAAGLKRTQDAGGG
jgi:unsaturated rhamnogalacturonyl hydrolase